MTAGILLGLSADLESELVRRLDAPGSGVRVVRRCADLAEMLAAAGAGLGSVAVLASDFGADRAVVARLRALDVRVILVAGPGETGTAGALGADAEAVGEAGPLAEIVLRLAREAPHESRTDQHGTAQKEVEGTLPPGLGPPPPPPRPEGPGAGPGAAAEHGAVGTEGRLVTVWGPPGAPGRTTLAVNLADELAALGSPVLLADADTEAPSVAQVLGILDDASAVASVARLALAGRLTPAALLRTCPVVDPGVHVMTGLTRAERWREVPEAALDAVWEVARRSVPWTVVDTGSALDGEDVAGPGPRRHAATASALAAADVVVVVGSADPVGIRRLVMALGDLADAGLCPAAQRLVVANRVRSSAAGPAPERSVHEVLARFAGIEDPVLVPDDRSALDKALMQGRALRQVAPASPARAAIERLARRLAGQPGRGRRARRRFLARR